MIKKYVRGDASNPEGVIKALEELGGVNKHEYEGGVASYNYFINNDGVIEVATKRSVLTDIITECFEEISPVVSAPKVITNLDVCKWYFDMVSEGHHVQFRYSHDRDSDGFTYNIPCAYFSDEDETEVKRVRIDFGEWIPIEKAGIK